jgi:hypothetical protein
VTFIRALGLALARSRLALLRVLLLFVPRIARTLVPIARHLRVI